MTAIIYFFASVAGLVLVGGTLRSIKRNLILRPAGYSDSLSAISIATIEFLLWVNCAIAAVVAMPHPITILLVALIIGSLISASLLRYREESLSLNRWLRMAPSSESPLPELLDRLASGCRSRLAWKAKSCVRRLNCGESIADAARRAKLPLDADTVALLHADSPETNQPENHQPQAIQPTSEVLVASSGQFIHPAHESWRSNSRFVQQMTYVVVMVVLAWLLGMFIHTFIVPTLEEMFEELGSGGRIAEFETLLTVFKWVTFVGHIVAIGLLIWLSISLLIRWLPLWTVRLVPWFGRLSINHWRAQVLRSLGRGMATNQSDQSLLGFAVRSTRVRWIRSRCRTALASLGGGVTLPDALRDGRLVSTSEHHWLECAAKNGSLAQSLQRLSDDVLRRDTYRWNVRMSWLVPLTTVLVGIYVLAHAALLFHCMSSMIGSTT